MNDFLLFGGENCPACRTMEAWLAVNNVAVRKLDASDPLAFQHRVRSIPTAIRLVDGQEQGRITGFQRDEARRFFGV